MSFKCAKFLRERPDLVKIIGDEYVYGNSITTILKNHPELNNNRQKIYDSLDYLGIARRRHIYDWNQSFEDMVNKVRGRV